ncbi:hypothetical protein EPO04_01270 [Patescibacteria group bacterium]|nr:MAG: hypothetical protein EPO04_01270 [Patescibacteria group bacterium]
MKGPIDYIIVGFEGNKFDGSVLKALSQAIDDGVIALINLLVITRDDKDNVTVVDVADFDGETAAFIKQYQPQQTTVDQDDIDEVADLIEKNCSAGMLVIEQLWAKPLKKALLDANGVLLAEGRIHPEAAIELEGKGE